MIMNDHVVAMLYHRRWSLSSSRGVDGGTKHSFTRQDVARADDAWNCVSADGVAECNCFIVDAAVVDHYLLP
jgi:hypothetical protein